MENASLQLPLLTVYRDVKMQNILLTAKGVVKLGMSTNKSTTWKSTDSPHKADFGMARAYAPRPLTPGVVTIWYRSPELLLGTKYYNPSIDLWSAGLVLAELLQSAPCLTGETPIEQLSLTIKLIGSPTPDDLAALSAMGCPELIRWRKEGLASGRADNLDRKFLAKTSPETISFLRGLLKWDPNARWTAAEALATGKSRFAAMAEKWWKESPRAIDKELLPTFPEVRNAEKAQTMTNRGRAEVGRAGKDDSGEGDYVFDFGEESTLRRPAKRARAR